MHDRARVFALLVGLALVALLAAACGSRDEASATAGPGSTTASSSDGEPVGPARGATLEQASALRSGFPAGIAESFEYLPDAQAIADRVSAVVVGRLTDFELNPRSDDLNLYVPGYAGSAGVLRLFFELDPVVEAPTGADAGVVMVDTPYFIAQAQQAEHFGQLEDLKGVRFILFLEEGTIGNEPTGAYVLWEDPFAALAEGVDGQTVRVLHDTDLVSRAAIERGAREHPEASVPIESGPLSSPPPDQLTPLEGRPFDEVVDELQT